MPRRKEGQSSLRPARVCTALLAVLDASAGRSRKRKRDQRPDVIGMGIKRALLEQVMHSDPEPQGFEAWLLAYVLARESIPGTTLAIARAVLDEWRLAQQMPEFTRWLALGAPSADADSPAQKSHRQTSGSPRNAG